MGSALLERYEDRIAGVLSCYDRVVITGTLGRGCAHRSRKPMALLNLVYRDALFPRAAYRLAFIRDPPGSITPSGSARGSHPPALKGRCWRCGTGDPVLANQINSWRASAKFAVSDRASTLHCPINVQDVRLRAVSRGGKPQPAVVSAPSSDKSGGADGTALSTSRSGAGRGGMDLSRCFYQFIPAGRSLSAIHPTRPGRSL
jgi:hypothetical protein